MSSGPEALSVLRFASYFRIPFVSIRRFGMMGHLRFSGILSKISCTFSIHSWPRRKGDISSIYLYILSQPRKEDIQTGKQRHRAKKKKE